MAKIDVTRYSLSPKLRGIQKMVSLAGFVAVSGTLALFPLTAENKTISAALIAVLGGFMVRRAFSDKFWIRLALVMPQNVEPPVVQVREEGSDAANDGRKARPNLLKILMFLNAVMIALIAGILLVSSRYTDPSGAVIDSFLYMTILVNFVFAGLFVAYFKYFKHG